MTAAAAVKAPWTRARVGGLQATAENAKMHAGHASEQLLAIWEEWANGARLSEDERQEIQDSLEEARICIGEAIDELNRGQK